MTAMVDMAKLGPSKNTRCERVVRMALVRWGIRHELHKRLPGTPDLFVPGASLCIFVDGRFWHCRRTSRMRRMRSFWRRKLEANVRRDRRSRRLLRLLGYRTMTIWDDGLPSGLKRLKKLVLNLDGDPLHHDGRD